MTKVNLVSLFFILLFTRSVANTNCDTVSISKNRNNLGIYGGLASDLCYLNSNTRLFALANSSASLVYTDDSCKTWKQAFQLDSLEFECGEKGWGGGGRKVLTNNVGWVMAFTKENEGELSSSVISFQEGDSGTFQTLIDNYSFKSLGYDSSVILNIGLTDYFTFTLLGHYIYRKNAVSYDVTDISSVISSLPDTTTVTSIAIANNSNGYPYYIVLDTLDSQNSAGQLLYRFDGAVYSKIMLPLGIDTVNAVFTHPNQALGDTIFISCNYLGFKKYYRSYDMGNSWTDITIPTLGGVLSDITSIRYSSNLETLLPNGKGLIIATSGEGISKDMGANWDLFPWGTLSALGLAIHPKDTNFIVACDYRVVVLGTNGVSSTFLPNENIRYPAIQVNKIARSDNKSVFYLATDAGLAYTTAYLNDSVGSFQKWKMPYGSFPVSNLSEIYTTVAIDPSDSLHVIAGFIMNGKIGGFSVSTTGPIGFKLIIPFGINKELKITDISFVSSNLIFATTTGNELDSLGIGGSIWRSTNGGDLWTNVSPSGFSSGNTIAVGYGKIDTVIYVGSGSGSIDTGYIWKSTDMGFTWTKVNSGPKCIFDSTIIGLPILDIAVDPRGTDTLYIAGGDETEININYGKANQAFVKSIDGGQTYTSINYEGEKAYQSVVINHNNPDSAVYVANGRDLLLYSPAIDTVVHVHRFMPSENIPDIAIGSILVGTTTGFYFLEENVGAIDFPTEAGFQLSNNLFAKIYPNPTAKYSTLELEVSEVQKLTAYLTDITGHKVQLIAENTLLTKGINRLTISMENMQSGIYFLYIETNTNNACMKVVKM